MASELAELFTFESLVHAISGATGGITAISVFFPLNSVRLRVQVDSSYKDDNPFVIMKKIAETEGIGSLYRGWWSSVVSLGASNMVYFYFYNALKTIFKKRMGVKDIDPITNLAVASIAGVINVLITTPLWVVGTRLATQRKKQQKAGTNAGVADDRPPYKGIVDCLTRIVSEEGLAAAWKGVWPSMVLVSNPSIQFVTYERLRGPMARMAEARGSPITSLEFFVMGAIAKAVATVFTYPLQLAQSKLRADKGKAKNTSERTYQGTLDVLQKIAAKNGIKGLFRGMNAKLWQTVLTAAFQFLTYETVQGLVFSLLLGGKAKGKATSMSIAGAAKASTTNK